MKERKPEDRHRLQDVEQRDQHHLGAPALGGQRGVDEGEDERADDRQPASASSCAGRSPAGSPDRARSPIAGRLQGCQRFTPAMEDKDEAAEHQSKCQAVPEVGDEARPDSRQYWDINAMFLTSEKEYDRLARLFGTANLLASPRELEGGHRTCAVPQAPSC